MECIGGYFGLELLPCGEHFHKEALRLHTARMGFEYILLARQYKKVYLPYYTCEVVLEPLQKLNVEYEFYPINPSFEPVNIIELQSNEAFLYTNYFGLKQQCVERLAQHYGKYLIVDNSQAFFAPALPGIDTFYSPRKFFGIPDGCYLYCDKQLDIEFTQAVSYDKMNHLLKRLDIGAEAGYEDFKVNDMAFCHLPIMRMSALTEQMLRTIQYQSVMKIRQSNFRFLDNALRKSNQLEMRCEDDAVPMVYPFLTEDKNLKQRLIENKIFVATYWPNVLSWCEKSSWEYRLAQQGCFLPIDQRYGDEEMNVIVSCIL